MSTGQHPPTASAKPLAGEHGTHQPSRPYKGRLVASVCVERKQATKRKAGEWSQSLRKVASDD